MCLIVLTENLGMQLVSAKFVHDFWLKKKKEELTDLLQQLEVDEKNLMQLIIM